jgi:peptide deformylase
MEVSKLDIVPYPHPALRWVSKEVPSVTPLVQEVTKKMIEIMHDYKGAGIAANQVAVPWRIFITFVNEKEIVFINPKVHLGRNEKDNNPRPADDCEGCLSFPGLKVEIPIRRARDVYVKALDINGKPFTVSGPGMLARVIQHENDHLYGKLFIDHLPMQVPEVKDFVDGWLAYLSAQYDFMVNKFVVPKYGNDEQEKCKLAALEDLLEEAHEC